MDDIIFSKREHLSERQQVVRTLKTMASMEPIARLWSGSIGTLRDYPLPANLAAKTESEIPHRWVRVDGTIHQAQRTPSGKSLKKR